MRIGGLSTLLASPMSSSPGTTSSSASVASSTATLSGSNSILTTPTPSRGVGGCDFARESDSDTDPRRVLWTPAALPTVIPLIDLPPELRSLVRSLDLGGLGDPLAVYGGERVFGVNPGALRLADERSDGTELAAVLLPLDALFEIRLIAAVRLARALSGRRLGLDPSALPANRRARLLLALRALDGRLDHAGYRDIAEALFGADRVPDRGWKKHDLRDRTVRLAQLGFRLMRGGYRHLLLHPYRRKI